MRLKGGYYTLDFNPQVIKELELESGTSKEISRNTNNPFIKHLNELVDNVEEIFKFDKPILIKYSNGDGNYVCKFNDSGSGAISLLAGNEELLSIFVYPTKFDIKYEVH